MPDRKFKVVKSDILSSPYEPRFIVIDPNTGRVLDDAQGYGYKTFKNAFAGYAYKQKSPQQRKAQEKKKEQIARWLSEHQGIKEELENAAIHIAKGSYGQNVKFDTSVIKRILSKFDIEEDDLPFTYKELAKELK